MGTEASGRAAISCYLLLCYSMSCGIIIVAAGRKLEEDVRPCRETADWKTEKDPPYLDGGCSKMTQTTQCGCHQPLPTDWSSLSQPSLNCFSAATHTNLLLPRLGWEQPAAGPCGSLKSPKPPSSSSPAWCTVPWSWAWCAGGLRSGLPVRKNSRFRFTGGSKGLDSHTLPTSMPGREGLN